MPSHSTPIELIMKVVTPTESQKFVFFFIGSKYYIRNFCFRNKLHV